MVCSPSVRKEDWQTLAAGQEQYRNTLSVVIPTLNAAHSLAVTLASVADADEIVVVDGGSSDGTQALAARSGHVCSGRPADAARNWQSAWRPRMANGCCCCTPIRGWPRDGDEALLARPTRAGYFRFALDSDDPRARRLERLVAWRCRVLALPYGDQGLLIHRDLLAAVGGIRPLPLMEDVDLVRRLGRRRLVALEATAITSAEKWQRQGWYSRSLRNLTCLTLYFAGVPPRQIARLYR